MAEIVMLLQEYFPQDVRVWKEASALKEVGHKITVICLRKADQPSVEDLGGIHVKRVNLTKKRGSKFRYIYEYLAFFLLAKRNVSMLLKKGIPDIIYIHNLPDFLVFAASKAKRKGAKVILDMHEIMPEFYMSKFHIGEAHPVIKVLKFIEAKSLRYADQIITINHALKRKFESRARPLVGITIVMNTVSDEVFPRPPREKNKKFIAMYHGTLTKTYNLEFVVRALPDIRKHLNNFEFHIYGDGTELAYLMEVIKELQLMDCVLLKGRIKYDQVPKVMAEASLGIIPLQRDVMLDLSFSNKLAEYVHMGLPVLHSEIPSVVEYFPKGSLSYFKSGDTADFQTQLVDIYKNYKNHLLKASEASRIYQSINWEVMKKELNRAVQQVLKSNN